jgi:hypothetical protein
MSSTSLFQPATNSQAYLKAGLMGFAGDGKTYTATEIAIGLVELMRKRGVAAGDRPAMFLDTETGSDWVRPQFAKANIPLEVAKTRAFVDLITAINEAEKGGSVLVIDSISHFWTVLCDEYATRKKRTRGLEFSDWAWLKKEWRRFTDLFVNSQLHIIMCGRAGFEYDFFQGEDGKKNLEKTGIKMKAEGETGYEPSILISMEKHMEDLESKLFYRTATIMKDRSSRIDGKQFRNPTFKDFMPHIEFLNLGGQHVGVDSTRDNAELFAEDGEPRWQKEKRMKEIALDEIVELLNKHYPGSSNDVKKQKGDQLEYFFSTRSWERIQTFDFATVSRARNQLWEALEGKPYVFIDPATDAAANQIMDSAERAEVSR